MQTKSPYARSEVKTLTKEQKEHLLKLSKQGIPKLQAIKEAGINSCRLCPSHTNVIVHVDDKGGVCSKCLHTLYFRHPSGQITRAYEITPNEKCICGSGVKYKKCCSK